MGWRQSGFGRFGLIGRSRRRRLDQPGVQIGLAVLGLLFGLFLFDRLVMPRVVHHGRDTIVPDLKGTARDHAVTNLRAARLRPGLVLEESDPGTEAGRIISQDPPAGARVRRGRHVRLLVSEGAEVRKVPDLAGKTVRSARLELADLGLQQGAVLVLPSDAVAEGEIMGTHPARGAVPVRNESIDLLVSGGPQRVLYLMPDLRGLDYEDAAARLRSVGIQVASPEGGAGRVSAQEPVPGEAIAPGDYARLE